MKTLSLAAPMLLLLSSCSQGGSPNLQIRDSWARETVAGQTSTAAYQTIANEGTADDRLVASSVAKPAEASIHATENSGGVSRMRELSSGVAIPAGSTIELRPGGTHIMITGLQAPLRRGEMLRLNLRFETSGEKPVDVPVAAATGPEAH